MTGSDGIDIEPFHKYDVAYHRFTRKGSSSVGIELMTVGAFNIYGFAVEKKLPVPDLNFTESNPR